MFYDDEDEEVLYEDGRWVWNDTSKALVYEKDLIMAEADFAQPTPAVFGPVEFRDDLDLIEQQRFRKRYQRKVEGDDDVIYLQDVKDVVLYTTPSSILTPTVVKILHLSTTDRFLRALIFYCQYYVQVAEEMSGRVLDLETKIRTTKSNEVELELRENIEDLRLLVAKEYATMIIGGADFRKFHHMGSHKKSRSLSKKDALIFESVLRIAIQIVWLALGRKSFNMIELEINRMFKSQIFNMIEHKLQTNYVGKMTPYERDVLIGDCLRHGGKLTTKSPLMNGLLCHRHIDFRLLGLGVIKLPLLTTRLRYMEQVLTMDERLFRDHLVSLGILGLTRSQFDTMLRKVSGPLTSVSSSSASTAARASMISRSSMRKSKMDQEQKLYAAIVLPDRKYENEWTPEDFPTENVASKKCDTRQRLKWQARASQITNRQSLKNKSRK